MSTEERIREFMTTNFYVPSGMELKPTTSFLDMGLIDSTGVLEVVSFLEREFAITIEDSELVPENLDSIANVSSFVDRKRGKL
jgi:acyl carrier protein